MKILILIFVFSCLSTVFGLYCNECSDVRDTFNNISGFEPCANGAGKQVGCSGSCAKIEYILNGKSVRFCWPMRNDTEGCITNPKGVSNSVIYVMFFKIHFFLFQTIECFCNSDLCNGSDNKIAVSSSLLISIFVMCLM